MNKADIIGQIAKEQRVERIIANITHGSTMPELDDLSQMIYLILLEYADDKIIDLWENDQINFFIIRIIMTQWQSPRSTFHTLFRKYRNNAIDISGRDYIDE